MTHEKIFIREDGGRVKVAVTLTTFPMTDEYLWNHSVQFCPKGKRKLQYKHDAATAEEILQTKLELHEKIRPS